MHGAPGCAQKLITTNTRIEEYDFYHPDNLLVADHSNPVVPQAFFEAPYRNIPKDTYARYWLDNRIGTLFRD